MLVESLVLAGAGGGLGLALAWGGIQVMGALEPGELPRVGAISIDPAALTFTALATIVAALLFGIIPALRASRPNVAATLREGGRTPGLAMNRVLRNGVVVAEVALSLVLLIGAGLMARSFIALQRVDPGWDPEQVLTFDVPVSFVRYNTSELRTQFVDRLQTELQALPGVSGVSAATPLPLSGISFNGRWGKAEALADPAAFQQADFTYVAPGYFDVMGTGLIAGRPFSRADHADSVPIVVVDEVLARKAFPNGSAVGERILVRLNAPEPEWMEIIGVVRHQRRATLAEDGRETVFFTYRYSGAQGALSWIVRTNGDPSEIADGARAAVRRIDPLSPISNLMPFDAYVDRAMAPTRFALVLIACFGGVALLLAAVGLYGVLAYAVRQRTAEIGLRVAMGATQQTILALVVRQGLVLSLAGIGLGTLGAFGLTRVMRSLLVGVTPTDPLTFGSIGIGFLAVTTLASLLPARRASRVDPLTALRTE
jgi:putative ABC transport system permease protein